MSLNKVWRKWLTLISIHFLTTHPHQNAFGLLFRIEVPENRRVLSTTDWAEHDKTRRSGVQASGSVLRDSAPEDVAHCQVSSGSTENLAKPWIVSQWKHPHVRFCGTFFFSCFVCCNSRFSFRNRDLSKKLKPFSRLLNAKLMDILQPCLLRKWH